jgi:hypothetical protein
MSDAKMLTVSPFRLGEPPNIRPGVAMITSAPEAISLHEKGVNEMWRGAIKGPAAAAHLRSLLTIGGYDEPEPSLQEVSQSVSRPLRANNEIVELIGRPVAWAIVGDVRSGQFELLLQVLPAFAYRLPQRTSPLGLI